MAHWIRFAFKWAAYVLAPFVILLCVGLAWSVVSASSRSGGLPPGNIIIMTVLRTVAVVAILCSIVSIGVTIIGVIAGLCGYWISRPSVRRDRNGAASSAGPYFPS